MIFDGTKSFVELFVQFARGATKRNGYDAIKANLPGAKKKRTAGAMAAYREAAAKQSALY